MPVNHAVALGMNLCVSPGFLGETWPWEAPGSADGRYKFNTLLWEEVSAKVYYSQSMARETE
jgi:hypothetical protein